MPIPEYHLFRLVDDEEGCYFERTHANAAFQTPLHHSGACWCRSSSGEPFTVPERNGNGSGVGYVVRRVEPDERVGLFCGDQIRDNNNHIHFQVRNTGVTWFHFEYCWCQMTDNNNGQELNGRIDVAYPHALFS